MAKMGVLPDKPVDRREASEIIGQQIQLRRQLPPTPRQERFLRAEGKWKDGMTYGEAYDAIAKITEWR
jgi:hypothetical protein